MPYILVRLQERRRLVSAGIGIVVAGFAIVRYGKWKTGYIGNAIPVLGELYVRACDPAHVDHLAWVVTIRKHRRARRVFSSYGDGVAKHAAILRIAAWFAQTTNVSLHT